MKVAFSDFGKGKAVVLLHGFLEDMRMWNGIQEKLGLKNRVIAIDLLGHGQTGNLGYIHTMEDQAEMVYTLLNSLRLRKFTFIGHSMGGYVSLAYAELHSDQIRGLCLMNSTPFHDSNVKKTNRDRAIKAVKHNKDIFIKMAIPNLFSEANKVQYLSAIDQLIKEASALKLQGIIASLEGMKIRNSRTEVFKSGTFKKLVIIGDLDPVIEYEVIHSYALTSGSELLILPGGHMSHIENTDALLNGLILFATKV